MAVLGALSLSATLYIFGVYQNELLVVRLNKAYFLLFELTVAVIAAEAVVSTETAARANLVILHGLETGAVGYVLYKLTDYFWKRSFDYGDIE